MRLLDLFSGIGGFHLSAEWVWGNELECIGHVEIDPFCQKVLKKHWPDVPIYEDIHELKGEQFQSIDLITGGFPCQPFSQAGKQRGKEDDRYLWPEMLRVISEVRPRWIIGENVTGILQVDFDHMLSNLETEGYKTEAIIIPACAVNAPHRRDRVWIMAHSLNDGYIKEKPTVIPKKAVLEKQNRTSNSPSREFNRTGIVRQSDRSKKIASLADSNSVYAQRQQDRQGKGKPGKGDWWKVEPRMDRMADGIPDRVDRLKSLGNAIVPQVAMMIMQAIKELEK